jgi:hypothetical protein
LGIAEAGAATRATRYREHINQYMLFIFWCIWLHQSKCVRARPTQGPELATSEGRNKNAMSRWYFPIDS